MSGIDRQRRIAYLCAQLICLPPTKQRPWADYTELAAAVDLDPEQHGLTDPDTRRDAKVELYARAAEEYGLGAREFEFLMNELFMTPKQKQTHAEMRDGIVKLL